MFRSLRGSTAAKNAPPPTVYTPPAFTPKKATGTLPPPPVRRVSAAPAAPTPEPEEDAEPEPEQEEEAGAWAEALYDYTSEVRLLFPFVSRTMGRSLLGLASHCGHFEGGERSAFTSGRESTGDRTDFVRLVRKSKAIDPRS